jgi:hypothetical protein
MRHALLALLVAAVAAVPAQGEHRRDNEYERVLVPVFFNGPGANGAQWATNVDVLNTGNAFDTAQPVVGEPLGSICNSERHIPQRTGELVCPENQHAAGIILYVPRNVAYENLHISARVLDQSRANDRYGTAIPVIWEQDLLVNPMVLLDIPTGDTRYRASLRLYDVYQWNTQFTLKFYDMAAVRRGETTPMFVTQVTAVWDHDSETSQKYPARPAFALIGDLVSAYPQLKAAQSVAIEVTGADSADPDQPETRLYALASITNNRTQEVTIVAPK